MKRTILLTAFVIGMASLSNAQEIKAAPAANDNKNQAEFKFENLEYNYGTIKQGDKVEYTFNFTNTGKEPLIITSAQGSCGCTVPEWPKEPIKKGENGKIHVTFNSAGKMGLQDKTVTINSNAKTNPVVLHIKGNIEAAPAAEPTK
ncbi:MAG: DUF1573 domain-containing protein [Bacteroidetes bacterium]|jgi:hypothetical protein|nr:DUF1573 domain-containing protein [Bacteroidota bacterium]